VKTQTHRRIRDLILYLLISAIIVGAVVRIAVSGVNWNRFFPLLCFAVFTPVLFGYFIAGSHSFFRRRSFWLLTTSLLAAHCIVFMLILSHVQKVIPISILFVCIEWLGFTLCRDKILGNRSSSHLD